MCAQFARFCLHPSVHSKTCNYKHTYCDSTEKTAYLCFGKPADLYVAIHSDPHRHPDTIDHKQEKDGVANVREKHTERVAGLHRGRYHRQNVRDEEEDQKTHI